MFKVYIADDENEVRQGLKKIINWQELGYTICGEAGNGLAAYNDIISLMPDLVLLDIRMPKMQGLEVAAKLRESKYKGRIIVLSGYSEFKYAQEAIKYDVDYYLTKPIEEIDLTDAVVAIRENINKVQMDTEELSYYQVQAKDKIIKDMITMNNYSQSISKEKLYELNLYADSYQVIIMESFKEINGFQEFCKLLNVPLLTSSIERLSSNEVEIILLKGMTIIKKFKDLTDRNYSIKDNKVVMSCGHTVINIREVFHSYNEALYVNSNRFFVTKNILIAQIGDIPCRGKRDYKGLKSNELGDLLYDYISVLNTKECIKLIYKIQEDIINSNMKVDNIKSTVAGLYIYVTNKIKNDYQSHDFEFLSNEEIIKWVQDRNVFNHIIKFMNQEVERIIKHIKGLSNDTIVDEIVDYLKHHYKEDIKLNIVASKFGYNSSYLGKLFRKNMEMNFNDYLHTVRINKSKELLLNEKYKIYEVSSSVGYKNVDYYHLKFKEFVGSTPNEYRLKNYIEIDSKSV